MRYGDADASGYPVPDVPSLPGASNTRGSGRDVVREDPRAVDIDILQQDNFDPDACALSLIPYKPVFDGLYRSPIETQQLHRSRAEDSTIVVDC